MIVVVADDFSGAAEVAGWAVAQGWRAELQTHFRPSADAQLVVVDVDTRSLSPAAAAARWEALAERVRAARPADVFQKIDSVLRGHVALETTTLARCLGKTRAVAAPANPSRGRVIRDGRCFIHDLPLDQTHFARDPEHPRRSASVADLLAPPPDWPLHVIPPDADWPDRGLIVPSVSSDVELAACLAQVDASTHAAGAADFFAAWLARRSPPNGARSEGKSPGAPRAAAARRLLVCGSPAAIEAGRVEDSRARLIPVLHADAPLAHLTSSLLDALAQRGSALLALDVANARLSQLRERLERLISSVAAILPRLGPLDVLVEGGATAGGLVQALEAKQFVVQPQAAPGVVPLQPLGDAQWRLVCKPGSYEWPSAWWPN